MLGLFRQTALTLLFDVSHDHPCLPLPVVEFIVDGLTNVATDVDVAVVLAEDVISVHLFHSRS